MARFFGTDGFRGRVGEGLTAAHAWRIGRFLGWYYGRARRARVAIGKDTRISSYTLEYALAAGLTASGADAYILHVTTTPSVAFVTRTDRFDCGIMISASHNPFFDNGIKLINANGEKMEQETLEALEAYLADETRELPFATGEEIGVVVDHVAGRNRYIGYLISLSTVSFRGLRVGLDCANGSAWSMAKSVFDALGACTAVIHDRPNGKNINKDAGSTHIEALCELVVREGLDVGFAFDGDADRCIAVNERGEVVDGDAILYVMACHLKRRGMLDRNTVVTTVMSNLGLERALKRQGIETVSTAVGDKYVYEAMAKGSYCLGGEQSGHIIFSRLSNTGDGLLTAILLTELLVDREKKLSELTAEFTPFPQILENVAVRDRDAVMADAVLQGEIRALGDELGERGRILVRASGTEPVIRVMVEAEEAALCREYSRRALALLEERRWPL